MKFGRFPLSECEGAVLAHSFRSGKLVIRKGTVLSSEHLAAIADSGETSLIAARLEPGDVGEDEAAGRLAAALGTSGIEAANAGTGRVNLHASHSGVLRVSREAVDAINAIDPGITLATLADHEPVLAGRMVATVKIIPYSVEGAGIARAEAIAGEGSAIAVNAYRPHRVGLISTRLPALKDSVIEKTERLLAGRLEASGSSIVFHERIAHEAQAVEAALRQGLSQADMFIIFGASAICDPADVIPAGLEAAGGKVKRLGMPVDPGNLMMLGELGGKPVIGAPGCARSPARNGFDFVLERLLAGLEVSGSDIAGMGVGGLLMEIASRPQPRNPAQALDDGEADHVAAVVLAAGQSRRMGEANKLLLPVAGKPMLRHAVDAALNAASIREVVVVTGHDREAVELALGGLDLRFVHNPAHEEGLSTSLRSGVEALGREVSHAVILLADMPQVDAAAVEALVAGLKARPGKSIGVALASGKRGNPVIWSRAWFDALASISGDTGARHVLEANRDAVAEVEIGEAGAFDVDTPQAYEALTRG